MKILIVGSGGREHALLWALKKSSILTQIYVIPGSDAMEEFGVIVDIDMQSSIDILKFCKTEGIELVIIGPEKPIIDGLADILITEGISVFAPTKAAAKLEASKSFTKDLCKRYGIPTPNYKCFIDDELAKSFVCSNEIKFPLVVKANGIASGKGVIVCDTESEAIAAIDSMLVKKEFGISGEKILIEEFLHGEEISFFTFINGLKVVILGCARDYKRVHEGNVGKNTGGMGALSSASIMSMEMEKKIIRRIIYPTIQALFKMGISYRGVLFAGIMIYKNNPVLLEYNVRFGDPEIQSILPRIDKKHDLLEIILLLIKGELNIKRVRLTDKSTVCVVVASSGYPDTCRVGEIINGLDKVQSIPGIFVFHAGTRLDKYGNLISSRGRVLNIVGEANSIKEARNKVYSALSFLKCSGVFFRHDIGV